MKSAGLWHAVLIALASVSLLLVLAPIVHLMFSSTPATIWETLRQAEVLNSLGLTFSCGLLATGFGLILGVPLAYLLARYDFPLKSFFQGAIDLPVVIPHPVAGIALLLLFSGFRPEISPVGRWSGIVVAMFFVSVSLLVNSAAEGFRAVPVRMEWTSRSLGLGPVATFFRVTLPLTRSNLVAGSIMMWARSISEFGAIVILAYNPKVASVLIWDRFSSYGLGYSLPVAVILIWTSLILFSAMRAVQGRKGLVNP